MLSSRVPLSRCLKLIVICCSLVEILVERAESSSGGHQRGSSNTELEKNQESILRDYVVDLKRLTSLQQAHQDDHEQPHDQLASANHESFVLDDAALLSQLLLASGSAPLPQGRRRLDDVTGPLMTLPTDGHTTSRSLASLNLAPRNINRRAKSGRGGGLDKIVDNGTNGGPQSNSIPYSALVAMMTNNNFNRVALASAMRSQRAQVNQVTENGLKHQRQLEAKMLWQQQRKHHHHQQQQRQMGTGSNSNNNQMGRQESKVNRKRMRSGVAAPAEKLNEFASRNDGDKDEGLDDGGDEEDERSADDDGDQDQGIKSKASRRQSKDDIFNELDDDEGDNESVDGGRSAKSTAKSGSYNKQLRQAASRQRPSKGGKQSSWPQRDEANEQPDEDEDIDSTNVRQLTSKPGAPPNLMAKVNRDLSSGMKQQQQQLHSHSQFGIQQLASLKQANKQRPLPRPLPQQLPQQHSPQPDDDLSAASHVLNSSTDLQTAAGKHYGGHHYHQMVEVPKKKAYKMSFKRGNHKHEISKHEKLHKHKFHTKFMWHAKEKCKKKKKCKSVGKMTWEYKHDKKHHHHHR